MAHLCDCVHEPVSGSGSRWPALADAAGPISPKSWATAVLGQPPLILEVGPDRAAAGDSGFNLTVKGQGFVEGSQVLWDGQPLATQFIDENNLEAAVTAADIEAAATIVLRVVNPDMAAAPSNKLLFPVENGEPGLDSIAPHTAAAGSSSLEITARGTGFVPGTKLLWNGRLLDTEVLSNNELRAQVPSGDLGFPGTASVLAHNPAPGGGSSAAQAFVVEATEEEPLVLLPLILRGR